MAKLTVKDVDLKGKKVLVHVGFSTDAAHDLNDQTEADEVGFQFAAEGFLCLAF